MESLNFLIHHLACDDIDGFSYCLSNRKIGMKCITDGTTVLHHIASRNGVSFLKRVLAFNPQTDLNVTDVEGNTPLHYAVRFDSFECLMVLLENGANPAIRNNEGFSIVHEAILQKSWLKYMREFNRRRMNINVQDNSGWTPLHYAYHINDKVLADFLIKNGASRTIQDHSGAIADYYNLSFDFY